MQQRIRMYPAVSRWILLICCRISSFRNGRELHSLRFKNNVLTAIIFEATLVCIPSDIESSVMQRGLAPYDGKSCRFLPVYPCCVTGTYFIT